MKISPRTLRVQEISLQFKVAVNDLVSKNMDLTHHELTSILVEILQYWNKCAIREERKEGILLPNEDGH